MACVTGDRHDLIVVYTHHTGIEAEVVRWCRVCGGVAVDTDYDGRTQPGDVMPMQFPVVARRQ